MSLHRLTTVTVGVPNVEETAGFYRDFGLSEIAPGRFATRDGGEQLRLVPAPRRRLVELGLGVDDPDDVDRIERSLTAFGVEVARDGDVLRATEPASETIVAVTIATRIETPPVTEDVRYNRPGRVVRENARASALDRDRPVQPRKLGHVVLGSTDQEASQRFFQQGIGFKVSDQIAGAAAFMRCSTDHHNLLVQAAPVRFLHHTSWQVEDVDDIGRGAKTMLAADPARHVWGLGRHHIGSNFFWYLRDPAGNFAEYYADLDVIVDDEVWKPQVFADIRALYSWGPPVPPSFIVPDDLADLMVGAS